MYCIKPSSALNFIRNFVLSKYRKSVSMFVLILGFFS